MSTAGHRPTRDGRRTRYPHAVVAASISLVVASCGSATPTPVPASAVASGGPQSTADAVAPSSDGAPQLPDAASIFNSTETPIDLTVTLERDNTVSAAIPLEGGALSATGADGTVYTLTIPDDALLVPTEISMTPVASVAGLPTSGESTHAVQLGPDGLELQDFAVLTIAPPEAIPVDQQITFGYEGEGQAMFLALPVVKDPQISIDVLHFSGYAVTKGLLASLDDVRKRFGGDAEARLMSYLAAFLAREHALEMSGHPMAPDYWAAFEDILDAYERDVVQPRVAAAGKSCANAQLAFESVKNLDRQRQVMEFDRPNPDHSALQTIMAHVCTQEEYELCRDDHIVHRMLTVILGFERQRQLDSHEDEAEWTFEKDLARKCLTFEVRFGSEATVTQDPLDVDAKMKSTVQIALDTSVMPFVIKGESALTNTALDLRLTVKGDCSVQSLRGGSELKVTDLHFKSTPAHGTDPGELTDIELKYQPTESTDNGTIKCPGTPTQLLAGPWWSAIYLGTHASEKKTPDGAYTATEWKVKQRTEKVGTKEWDYSFPAARMTDEGSFELYHRPQ